MAGERRYRFRIHWAWVPAALLSVVGALIRWGWATTLALVFAGLALAGYVEWRAARRRGRADS